MAARMKMPCARALYRFQAQASHELDFNAGVSIKLLRRVDENWLEGKLDGKVGIFPASHVKIEVGSPSMSHENALASSGKPYAVALHTFQGTQAGDLSFSKGDLIELLGNISTTAHGWIKGKLGSDTGIFPASYVAILRYPEGSDMVDTGTKSTNQMPVPKPRPHPRKTPEDESVTQTTPTNLTPSRSAPAPPTNSSTSQQHAMKYGTLPKSASHSSPPSPHHTHQSFGTLPKPKPRKLPRATASSSRVDILQSELAIEHKLLESAETLLVADQSQAKSERRNKAIATHKSTISLLEAALADAKAENEEKVAAATAEKTAPPLPPPPRQTNPVSSKEQKRSKVVDELIFTERDFHHQMELCSSKVIPALREVPDIEVEVLFGNMEEVTQLSGEFLSALEKVCQDKQPSVGGVFMTFAPKMRGVYGAYCRNNDTSSALYEKYLDTPAVAESIHHAMDMLRGEIQAWDLQSLLIKPMQRVLKYPLLLDKLVQYTIDSHPDYKTVHSAKEAISRVAQDINEIKRRKDLVVKYTGPKDERRGSLTVHSLQKKMRRFQQTLTQFTGLRTKTIDPKFDEIEQKVVHLESLIRNLLRDIASWQEKLQHVVESRVTLMEGMALFSVDSQPLSQFQSYIVHLQQEFKSQAVFVKEHVTVPLETLLGLFQNPLHLIQKRKDKLLDSDHMQYALERAEDPEKIAQLREESLLAKRNYEALNTQLLEELPHFLEAVVSMLKHQLSVLTQAQHSFTSSMSSYLQSLPCLKDSAPSSSQQIQQQHAEEMIVICKELSKLSLVPATLGMNFSIRAGGSTSHKSSDTNSASSSNATTPPVGEGMASLSPAEEEEEGEGSGSEREEEGEEGVKEREEGVGMLERVEEVFEEVLSEGSKLQVLFDFVGQDEAELSVVAGEVVVLLCAHDRIGCKEWWLVQQDPSGAGGGAACTQGYVPAAYLEQLHTDS